MNMSITNSSDTRADAGAMEDNIDPDPEVPEREGAENPSVPIVTVGAVSRVVWVEKLTR